MGSMPHVGPLMRLDAWSLSTYGQYGCDNARLGELLAILRRDTGMNEDRLRVRAVSCHGPHDPAFRVRLALPGQALGDHGFDFELLPLLSAEQATAFRAGKPIAKAIALTRARQGFRRRLRRSGSRVHAVMIQRYVDPAPMLTLERLAIEDHRLIYDVDDAVWLGGSRTGGHPLSVLKGTARKVRWLAERADRVIAGNEILAEHLAAYNTNITIVPSLVDARVYPHRRHEQNREITLGWIGSPTTARYLRQVAPMLEQFAKHSARPLRLIVVGGSVPPLAGVRIDERPWSPSAECDALAEMDIGLMPLPDTPWTRGKCAYKALQYMAAGVPAIVDDVGVSAATVDGCGCVASDATHWLEGLQALADDADLRTHLGRAGRERVQRDFSLERWAPVLAGVLREG